MITTMSEANILVKNNALRSEKVTDQVALRHGERAKNLHVNQRAGRKSERNDHVNNEIVDMQRRTWHNENQWNSKEIERQLQQGRQPSPETWCKPAEPPKPVSPETARVRYGKATSTVELAQAF